MADNKNQQANATIRTLDRSGIDTEIAGLDVAQSGEAERLGLPPSKSIAVNAAGLTTAATAYTAGDVLGTELTFANCARFSGGGTQLISASITDRAKILGAVDLYIFDRASTPAADNAANSWADADMDNLVTVINFGALIASALNGAAVAVGGLPVVANPNATSLFGVLVTRSAHTFFGAATDLRVKLGVIPD